MKLNKKNFSKILKKKSRKNINKSLDELLNIFKFLPMDKMDLTIWDCDFINGEYLTLELLYPINKARIFETRLTLLIEEIKRRDISTIYEFRVSKPHLYSKLDIYKQYAEQENCPFAVGVLMMGIDIDIICDWYNKLYCEDESNNGLEIVK